MFAFQYAIVSDVVVVSGLFPPFIGALVGDDGDDEDFFSSKSYLLSFTV